MNKFILDFKDITYKDFSIVGSKTYYLTRLLKKNFPVPNGFVVTTNGYQEFSKKNQLQLLHRSMSKNQSLKDAFITVAKIRNKILKGKIPKDFKEEITKKIKEYNFEDYSVRSSATVEDGHNSSFAGQFESYLNVEKNNILNKIVLCWASFFSDRVTLYAKRKNLSLNREKMAVMVHQMIDPEIAGNIFTVDVINRNKHFILIEAVKGGGHTVTDGTGIPQKILVNRADFSFIDKPEDIAPELIKELAQMAYNIEKFFQYPQDIEWAIAKGKIYILQSRPITII